MPNINAAPSSVTLMLDPNVLIWEHEVLTSSRPAEWAAAAKASTQWAVNVLIYDLGLKGPGLFCLAEAMEKAACSFGYDSAKRSGRACEDPSIPDLPVRLVNQWTPMTRLKAEQELSAAMQSAGIALSARNPIRAAVEKQATLPEYTVQVAFAALNTV